MAYRIGTKYGIMNRLFSRDEIIATDSSEQIKVLEDKTLSLREAMAKYSKFRGQSFKKCVCKPSKTQCNKCLYIKSQIKCNSRCDNVGYCSNK